MEKTKILYIHGQGGSVEEAEHYRPLFPEQDVLGLDYQSQTPWAAKEEFPGLLDAACGNATGPVRIIANSIGAYFAMNALPEKRIEEAWFISPIVNMQTLIEGMMARAKVQESELRQRGEMETEFGQTLSWEYLSYARSHPVCWSVPTHILYGGEDALTSFAEISVFAREIGADLTVMEQGEHWFHTSEQMLFLDRWIGSDRT